MFSAYTKYYFHVTNRAEIYTSGVRYIDIRESLYDYIIGTLL